MRTGTTRNDPSSSKIFPDEKLLNTLQGFDPLALAGGLMDLAKRFQSLSQFYTPEKNQTTGMDNMLISNPWEYYSALGEALHYIRLHPQVFYDATETYARDLQDLWKKNSWGSLSGGDGFVKVASASPQKGDRRFNDEEWHNNPFFKFIMDNYLLWSQWLEDIAHQLKNLDPDTALKVQFFLRQLRDAMAPTNIFWLNPQALRRTLDTQGANILQGIENLLQDLEKGEGQLDISIVDQSAFVLGKNIATTPGFVVYEHPLFQLIQYTPTTPKVYQLPLLIVPPCINKYYIFDLRPENSFVKWCLDQGLTVFVISWVNPDERLANKTFSDYILEGLGHAVEIIKDICRVPHINALGFCIGGNFLACLSAYLAGKKGINPLRSTSYLATIFDFEHCGDYKVFINKKQIVALERQVKEKGYFDGRMLAKTFNLIRANDMVWSFVINNYYMGEKPKALDLFYWNSDSTNLPATMYLQYLKACFLENRLIKPGGLVIQDVALDLGKITIPSFILSTKADHIAPWKSGYEGARRMGGPTRFVLGGSGHVAGILNHPHAHKYQYWLHDELLPSADDWIKKAQAHEGSWWQTWLEWLKPLSADLVKARTPGSKKYPQIEPAPGRYVR